MQWVLLIVAVHLKYHGLALHVLYEGPGDSYRDVLHVVEVQGCSFPIILEWFCREGLIMPVDKAKECNEYKSISESTLLELSENISVF